MVENRSMVERWHAWTTSDRETVFATHGEGNSNYAYELLSSQGVEVAPAEVGTDVARIVSFQIPEVFARVSAVWLPTVGNAPRNPSWTSSGSPFTDTPTVRGCRTLLAGLAVMQVRQTAWQASK
jgi:hypothetical protein